MLVSGGRVQYMWNPSLWIINSSLNLCIDHAGTAPDGTGDQQLEESITLCCCQECGKEFSNPRALHRHQKTHAGEKPHKCAQCGKGFNYLNRLKRHQLIHTQEKPFSCPACSRAFSRKDRLKEHLNTHSEWSAEAKEIDGSVDGEETPDSPDISDEEDVDWIPEGVWTLYYKHGGILSFRPELFWYLVSGDQYNWSGER